MTASVKNLAYASIYKIKNFITQHARNYLMMIIAISFNKQLRLKNTFLIFDSRIIKIKYTKSYLPKLK